MKKRIVVVLLVLVCLGITFANGFAEDYKVYADKLAKADESSLMYWAEDSYAKNQLVSFMKAITDENGPDYIPVEARIAVFDFDGTLFCETDLDYFDHLLLAYRVLEDAEYSAVASDFEKEVANKIVTLSQESSPVGGLDMDHGIALSSAFKGMTPEEFDAYIQGFKKTAMPHYTGMNRGDGFYLPMLQVIEYLQANEFLVYIVSGSDRFMVRAIINGSPVDLPPRQIIGSDMRTMATNQGEEDGLKYTFASEDEVLLSGDFVIKNLKMNKVSVIVQEIGQQPVLSFGNSTGDAAMANFVITDNPYRSLAFMLCCDDTEREHGNPKKADEMFDLCAQNNWIPVSMKNDWTTIYGDNVTYTKSK